MITRRKFLRNAAIGSSALFLPEIGIIRPRLAHAAIVEVGGGTQRVVYSGTTGEGSHDLVFPGNVTAGQALVCAGACWQSGAPPTVSISDTRGSSYAVFQGAVDSNITIFAAVGAAASTGANTVTVNPDGTPYISAVIDEFSGTAATPLDINGGQSICAACGLLNIADDITTGANDALIIGVMTHNGGTFTLGAPAGYTQIGKEEDGSGHQPFIVAFKIEGAAGAYTVGDFTKSGGSGDTWGVRSLSIAPTGVVPPSVREHRVVIQ